MPGNLTEGYFSLGDNINKSKGSSSEQSQGVVSVLMPELEVNIDKEELKKLTKGWLSKWTKFEGSLKTKQDKNEEYWIGKQYGDGHAQDNVLFESIETYLPIATSESPDPVVIADNTEEGIDLADKVHRQLVFLADQKKLKLVLKRAVRHWMTYYVGVAKISWDFPSDDIATTAVRPQRMILDPDATIDGSTYNGNYLGEYRKDTASTLVLRFPDKETFIKDVVKDKMGTEVQYIEWWTPDTVFWQLKEEILGIKKNPHWNYDKEVTEVQTDRFGNEVENTLTERGTNHFVERKIPYIFLSVFNIGKHPVDDTSLIEQCLPLQDAVNKRRRQTDKNTDEQNGSIVVDADKVTKEQATQAAGAMTRGETIRISGGRQAIDRVSPPPLSQAIIQDMQDSRIELKNIFGVRGSTPDGTQKERTVGGKIQIQGQDAGRIGAGAAEYIEQFADDIYNWWVQMMFVYYTEEHTASIIGEDQAVEFSALRRDNFTKKLLISVKPGSTIPQDPRTKRSEAVDLYSAGALDPITLFERLDFSDPKEAALRLWQWTNDPGALLPEAQQQAPPEASIPGVDGAVSPEALPPPQPPLEQSQVAANNQPII